MFLIIFFPACFYSVSQPLCGNGILDPGEECDCGPIVKCGRLEEGCNNPNLYLDPPSSKLKDGSGYKGCTLKKNYKCSAHEACCDLGKISETKVIVTQRFSIILLQLWFHPQDHINVGTYRALVQVPKSLVGRRRRGGLPNLLTKFDKITVEFYYLHSLLLYYMRHSEQKWTNPHF